MSKGANRPPPNQQYQALMTNIRARFEVIESLALNQNAGFAQFETAAFHLRKSVEGVAFGCLVAMEQGLKEVPRDAIGQWNADNIFARLKKRDQLVFPASFKREDPPEGSEPNVNHHIVPNNEVNLSIDEVRDIYRRSHKWLHEWNPYIERLGNEYEQSKTDLLNDIQKFWSWIVSHMIGIGGHVFLGLLKDSDGQVRIVAAQATN